MTHPCEFYIQMAEEYKKNYDDLVSKIHEKIESLQNEQSGNELMEKEFFAETILKSLLQ